jgi:hypothetical protein
MFHTQTTGKIFVLLTDTLIFKFLDSRRDDYGCWTERYQEFPEFSLLLCHRECSSDLLPSSMLHVKCTYGCWSDPCHCFYSALEQLAEGRRTMDVEFKDLSYTVKPRLWSRKGMLMSFIRIPCQSQVCERKKRTPMYAVSKSNGSFVFFISSFTEDTVTGTNLKAWPWAHWAVGQAYILFMMKISCLSPDTSIQSYCFNFLQNCYCILLIYQNEKRTILVLVLVYLTGLFAHQDSKFWKSSRIPPLPLSLNNPRPTVQGQAFRFMPELTYFSKLITLDGVRNECSLDFPKICTILKKKV